MKKCLIPLLVFFATLVGAKAQLLMRGDVDYWIRGSRLRLEMDGITNFEDARSDILRFRVWASKDHWETYDRGRLIAFGRLPRVQAHRTLPNIHQTVHLTYPDRGWYHITITLEERTPNPPGNPTWTLRDVITFDGLEYLQEPWDFWPF